MGLAYKKPGKTCMNKTHAVAKKEVLEPLNRENSGRLKSLGLGVIMKVSFLVKRKIQHNLVQLLENLKHAQLI